MPEKLLLTYYPSLEKLNCLIYKNKIKMEYVHRMLVLLSKSSVMPHFCIIGIKSHFLAMCLF